MLKVTLLLALSAICATQAVSLSGSRTADMDFIHKQKKIFNLLLYVRQADLSDAEWYDVGRNYNIESNMDMYLNKTVVQNFMWWYNQGMFLSRDAIFTTFNFEQMKELQMLFELFYQAKDFQTFYKTAAWARIHMNNGIFTSAFTTAVLYRQECMNMRLPAIYEIYPNFFYDSNVIQEAQNLRMSRSFGAAMDNAETHMVYANYSSKYKMPYSDDEYKLDYFMEDAGLNAYYYYIRQMFPFWMNSETYNMPKEIRGQLYYFLHQQLLARYGLERMSKGLGPINEFDWNRPIIPGFYSTLMYPNGIPFPQRNRYSSVPYYKYKNLRVIKALEMRIMDAIDTGYMYCGRGKKVDIYTPEGLNMIGNMIEGNSDSCDSTFYGMYDALARDILGFSFKYKNKNKMIPSALQCYCTSMRDPAFYMLYQRIMTYFSRYKELQPAYTQSDLQMPGVTFETVNMDKLYTFIDDCDSLINNAVAVPNMKAGKSLRLKARRSCMNYQQFTYRMSINSDRETKGMLRIFLGPAFDEVKQDMVYLGKYNNYFVEMDRFVVTLHPGNNTIERLSSDSLVTTPDMMPSDVYNEKLDKAISGSEPFMYSERMIGMPERLTLPRGRPEGMRFKMFFFVSPIEESTMMSYNLPMFGKIMFDGKPFGFPLDRPMWPKWNIPNMYFTDVYIYSRENNVESMPY
ncbi:Arylphorin subunit alpha [Eufriesea mexicana]|nr:Arylphorin subunit alpha [Eufriesea mexicana]